MVFADFVVPGPFYTAGLLGSTLLVGLLVVRFRPRVTQAVVLGLVPWMVAGATLHVLYQIEGATAEDILPGVVEPLLSAPSVYLTTFVPLGITVVAGTHLFDGRDGHHRTAQLLAGVGTALAGGALAGTVWAASGPGGFAVEPFYPLAGLLLSGLITLALFLVLDAWRPTVVARVRWVGVLVVFAHVFDAITTAIGVEVLGAGERSTVPRLLMDLAAQLPTAASLGEVWLFVLVKVLVGVGVVVLFADYVVEEPTEGNLFFALIAAVGLGPGVHNFLLFALGVGL